MLNIKAEGYTPNPSKHPQNEGAKGQLLSHIVHPSRGRESPKERIPLSPLSLKQQFKYTTLWDHRIQSQICAVQSCTEPRTC